MKQILLLLSLPFLSFFSLTAQITQEQADEIVIERLCNDTGDFTIYAKEDVQTNFEITTSTGETIELAYPCWVYYADFMEETNGKYLIVKVSNGNLLEVNTKNDEGPEGVEEWRMVGKDIYPIDIAFEEYSLSETLCIWANIICEYKQSMLLIINNEEEMQQYITCAEGDYPEIDFSTHTLLLIKGANQSRHVTNINKNLQKISSNEYQLNIELYNIYPDPFTPSNAESWTIAIIMEKINEECSVLLNMTAAEAPCQIENLDYPVHGGALVIINSSEELEYYLNCYEDTYLAVDFSTHSLLLLSGYSVSGSVEVVVTDFQLLSTNNYQLDIEVFRGGYQSNQRWINILIINKLNEASSIEINTTYKEITY